MASGSGEEQPRLKLYSYFGSSCSFRVRIALNLKGLKYEYKAVNVLKGEQHSPEFLKLNPIGYVPVLVDGDIVLADSLAISLYLDEKYPQHPLLPSDLKRKAINLQAANIVSSSIQPFQNMGVQKYIAEKVGQDEQLAWVKSHIGKGFAALEKLLKEYAGKYATGDEVLLADIFLAPQLHAGFNLFNLDKAANIVSASIQPLQNIGVLKYIAEKVGQDEQLAWVKFHIGNGFTALEKLLKDYAGKYATGDEVLLADIFLAPQLHAGFNRFNLDKSEFPLLARLDDEYSQIRAFQDAMPEKQPDTPSQSTA